MKRIVSLALALALASALFTGCGSQNSNEDIPAAAPAESQSEAQPAAPQRAYSPAAEHLTADPLTGGELTTDGKRPVAIMVNSDSTQAHQWGIARASVVVEAITTGQKTSLMCLYPSVDSLEKVGPVTEADDIYWQLAMPLNAIPVSINKTIYASNLLNLLRYQDLDGYYAGVTCFDYDSARGESMGNEFCWYTTPKLLGDGLELYGLTPLGGTGSLFYFSEAETQNPGTAAELQISYGAEDDVFFQYREDSQTYARKPQPDAADALTGEDVCFTNLFVLYAATGPKDDGHHWDYDLSTGTGLYLTKGGWQTITWAKGDAYDKLELYNADGTVLAVNPGKSYIGLVGGMNRQTVSLRDAAGNRQEIPQHE